MSVPAALQDKTFTLLATLEANSGKADRLEELLKPVVKFATSSSEPATLTYRLSRAVDSDKFIVFEEYKNADGLKAHQQGEAYQALMKAGKEENLIASMKVDFYREVKV